MERLAGMLAKVEAVRAEADTSALSQAAHTSSSSFAEAAQGAAPASQAARPRGDRAPRAAAVLAAPGNRRSTVALDEGAPPDAHMLAGLASSARALRSRVDGSAALAADGAVCATAGDAPDDLVLLACRSSLTSELDDAARKLDDASGLRAAAADPVDDVPVQTPHANCKQDVCIELADALIAGE